MTPPDLLARLVGKWRTPLRGEICRRLSLGRLGLKGAMARIV